MHACRTTIDMHWRLCHSFDLVRRQQIMQFHMVDKLCYRCGGCFFQHACEMDSMNQISIILAEGEHGCVGSMGNNVGVAKQPPRPSWQWRLYSVDTSCWETRMRLMIWKCMVWFLDRAVLFWWQCFAAVPGNLAWTRGQLKKSHNEVVSENSFLPNAECFKFRRGQEKTFCRKVGISSYCNSHITRFY